MPIKKVQETFHAQSITGTELTVNDAWSIVRHRSPRNLYALTAWHGLGTHRFRDDQCLSTRTGGMAAKSPRRGTTQIFLVRL